LSPDGQLSSNLILLLEFVPQRHWFTQDQLKGDKN
jgi:hypothetical protein